jgi:hypothetical protein
MAVDPFFRQPRTPEQWRARARAIQHQLKGLMIAQLLRGGADAPKHDPSIGGDGRGSDPNQPRVPAGHPDGGQWTNQASGDGARINDPRVLSDIEPDDPWILGADYAANFEHHWYAKHFYLRRPFSRETRKVFREATSGPLVQRLYSRRQQKWLSHGYGYDTPHRRYDAAIDELVTEYMRNRDITARQMTPAQAHEVVELIKKSSDPRIRDFVKMIKTLHRFLRRFGGRGNE